MKQNLNPQRRSLYAFADGDTIDTIDTTAQQAQQTVRTAELLGDMIGGPQRRRSGIRINGTFFPLSDIMLFGILLTVVVIAARRRN